MQLLGNNSLWRKLLKNLMTYISEGMTKRELIPVSISYCSRETPRALILLLF
jgi:hypothetical protein